MLLRLDPNHVLFRVQPGLGRSLDYPQEIPAEDLIVLSVLRAAVHRIRCFL